MLVFGGGESELSYHHVFKVLNGHGFVGDDLEKLVQVTYLKIILN